MKLAFEPNLFFQQDAIQSITRLFEGQTEEYSTAEHSQKEEETLSFIHSIRNHLVLSDEQILTNLQGIQENNVLKKSTQLS